MSYNPPLCPYDGGEPVLYREVNHNGADVVTARCHKCNRFVDPKHQYLSKSDHPNWQQYPLYRNNMTEAHKCEYKGCDRMDTENHHYAPQALFPEDADNYPQGWLCQLHHDRWHEKTSTGKWTKRKVVENESIPN